MPNKDTNDDTASQDPQLLIDQLRNDRQHARALQKGRERQSTPILPSETDDSNSDAETTPTPAPKPEPEVTDKQLHELLRALPDSLVINDSPIATILEQAAQTDEQRAFLKRIPFLDGITSTKPRALTALVRRTSISLVASASLALLVGLNRHTFDVTTSLEHRTEEVAVLQEDFDSLKETHAILVDKHNQTTDEYNNLAVSHTKLQEKYRQAQSDVIALKNKSDFTIRDSLLADEHLPHRRQANPYHFRPFNLTDDEPAAPAACPSVRILSPGNRRNGILDEFCSPAPPAHASPLAPGVSTPSSLTHGSLHPTLLGALKYLQQLDRYVNNQDRHVQKPKPFSSSRDGLVAWISDALHYMKANGKNFQYDSDRAEFLMHCTKTPARDLLQEPTGFGCRFDSPFEVIRTLWAVYGEDDSYGAAERAYSDFTFPRFPTSEASDVVAAFATFRARMHLFASQLSWSPQTHYFRLQDKLPQFILSNMASTSCDRTEVGLAQYYTVLSTFVNNYTLLKTPSSSSRPVNNDTRNRRTVRDTHSSNSKTNKPAFQPRPDASTASDISCYNCGGRGHKAPACPSPKKDKSQDTSTKPSLKSQPTIATNRHMTVEEPPEVDDDTDDEDYESPPEDDDNSEN